MISYNRVISQGCFCAGPSKVFSVIPITFDPGVNCIEYARKREKKESVDEIPSHRPLLSPVGDSSSYPGSLEKSSQFH